jgi:leukotriene-A4 hydrolase
LPPEDQILAIDLRGRNPEDVFSAVPYEKGRLFLVFLASRFGQSRFDEFLRAYFDHFAFQSIATEQFLGYLQENLLDKHPGIVSSEEIRAWVFGAGIPADAILPSSTAFTLVDAARSDWLAGRKPAAALDTRGWVTQQWLHFLNEMPASLRAAQLAELDKNYRFTASANAEILHSWLLLAIRSTYQPAYARLESYLRTIGRKKLIVPLYQELLKTPDGTQMARRIYAQARSGYHPLTAATLDEVFMKADAGATGN